MRNAIRWSDNDRYFGPFTYARDRRYRPIAISLNSGDADDYPHCCIRVSAFGHTLICRLPAIIKPYRHWHEITTEPTRSQVIAQGRRPGYWDTYSREYGFSIVEGAVHIHYGEQTHDSTTDKSKCYFLPWRSWRMVRHTLYDTSGVAFADLPKGTWAGVAGRYRLDLQHIMKGACPTVRYAFADYDGEKIIATCRIEEYEWALGEGNFKWLSLFWPNKIIRSMDLRFSSEVGRRKGSWKGGTVGHSCDIAKGEHPQEAFERYCAKDGLTFIGEAEVVTQENSDEV